jgi:hypothetical protein
MVITGNNPPEMFDVVNDPSERRNIVYEHKALAAQMRKDLTAWLGTETEESKVGRLPSKPGKKKPKQP